MIVWLALAGGAGAVLRWLVSAWFAGRSRLGTGTAVVNTVGALGLGVVTGLGRSGRIDETAVLILGVGFLGSLTTFSTWMLETAEAAGGHPRRALSRTLAPGAAGLLVAWLAMQAFK